jgi:preprotein translocase subunit SecY
MRRERPDGEKIQRLMKSYFRTVAIQGAMQIAIIFVMSHLATGI